MTDSDESKVEEHVPDKEIVGKAYQYAILDPLWELVYAVSADVIAKPWLYTGTCPDELLDITYSVGTSKEWPSRSQRMSFVGPLVGKSGESSDVHRFDTGRQKVLSAAVALTAAVYEGGEMALKNTLGTVAGNFNRNNIMPNITWAAHHIIGRLKNSFDDVGDILRRPMVRQRFGIDTIDSTWPEKINPNGTKLVESIVTQLSPNLSGGFSPNRFADLQHVADTGKAALIELADADGKYSAEILNVSIAWHRALQEMRSNA